MENLLLVLDELDDVYSTLGLVWRPILSFIVAAALFVGTVFLFFSAPWLAEVIGLTLIALGGLELLRQRRQLRDAAVGRTVAASVTVPVSVSVRGR